MAIEAIQTATVLKQVYPLEVLLVRPFYRPGYTLLAISHVGLGSGGLLVARGGCWAPCAAIFGHLQLGGTGRNTLGILTWLAIHGLGELWKSGRQACNSCLLCAVNSD